MNLEVQVVHVPVVNFAMQQNHVPVIREIVLKNTGEEDIKGLCVQISFEPDFAGSCQLHIESIAPGSEEQLSAIPIQLSTFFLSQLTERLLGHIHVEISTNEHLLFSESYEMSLLAFDQWGGISVLPEMLAAFVTPNHSVIAPIIKRASEILGDWTGFPALDEYQTRDPNRVKKQMAAIYEAIAEQQIAYCSVPASFEESGQRVRLYDDILSYKLANCLDMSLLYAGCLEAIGIHPLVVVVKGHAFAGGWLISDSFPDSVNDDVSLLTKRAAEGINEVLLLEATCMNAGMPQPFDAAVASANDKLKDTDNFLLFIDVVRARNAQIRPLPLRVIRDGKIEIEDQTPTERDLTAPSALSATDIIPNIDQVNVGKQTIWERKLLDLSLRNNLLNTRITRNTLQLISVRIGELEDALADGQEFQILERPQDWDNPLMSAGIYQALHASDPIIDLVKSELKQRRLRAYLTDEALRRSMTHLYRSSRLALEENGANTLYLALGLLKWLETPNSTRPRFAPILLLPIEIVRKSAAKGYVIRSRDEDTMLNITLLEMLRQYFGIQIGGLDPLPRDESGVDVSLIFNTIRRAIMIQKGWDVEEQAIIGNFSFSKFIMWNDIHNNADKLCRNKIVASLMSGKVEWTEDADESEYVDLDEAYPAGEITLPIGADSSQFEAICAAVDDKSFILHGPPGTGKSQTITNIIANALYKGKKVLFVAEKMAALQVVQRRLETIGIAPFCLELHSNKTKKSSVLEQLKRTTEVVKRKSNEGYRIEAEQINMLRRELNDYVHILHKQRPANLSLYDCFAGYASVDEEVRMIMIPEPVLETMNLDVRKRYEAEIIEFETICKIAGDITKHPFHECALTEYSSGIKSEIQALSADLIMRIDTYENALQRFVSLLGYDLESTETAVSHISLFASRLLGLKEVSTNILNADDLQDAIDALMAFMAEGRKRDTLKNKIVQKFGSDVLTTDTRTGQECWKEIVQLYSEQYVPKPIHMSNPGIFLNSLFKTFKLLGDCINDVMNIIGCAGIRIRTSVEMETLTSLCRLLLDMDSVLPYLMEGKRSTLSYKEIRELIDHGIKKDESESQLLGRYTRSVLTLDVDTVLNQWMIGSSKWFGARFFTQRRILKSVNQYATSQLITSDSHVAEMGIVKTYQHEKEIIERHEYELMELLGRKWNHGAPDWKYIAKAVGFHEKLDQLLCILIPNVSQVKAVKDHLCRYIANDLSVFHHSYDPILKKLLEISDSAFSSYCAIRTCEFDVEEFLAAIAEYQQMTSVLNSRETEINLLDTQWNVDHADWDALESMVNTVREVDSQLSAFIPILSDRTQVRKNLSATLSHGMNGFHKEYDDVLRTLATDFLLINDIFGQIVRKLQANIQIKSDTSVLSQKKTLVKRWMDNIDLLKDWCLYLKQRSVLQSLNLDSLIRLVESNNLAPNQILCSYQKSFFKLYAEYILSQEPQMNAFHGLLFEEKIRRFRLLSRRFEQLTREELYAKLASALPALQKEAAQNSEVGILQRNIRNGGRGTSIRRLFDQIPDLLMRMCPCLLMSPISVAQYIDADRVPFDLVIFDEASQMPTSEAVGAIARGRNVIVVGDPKQMPPTDFFSTNTYDEENADKEDLESILDDCLALSIPSKHLLWHYRSKHESLIAFSNVKYYDNRLLTFPSPDDLTTKVHFQYVNGTYDRGSTRQNRAEAEAIVREIKARLMDPAAVRRSIGVVTFNSNQQSLIEDLLNDLFRENPALETLALEGEEPIFIKNLENVQGDERDVILFSVGYGPDKTGRIALNFGPLNRDGGWRRLNVAVSRARYEMKVFSTLRADQIDLNRTSAEGVAGLKAFLEYAEKGREALSCQTSAEFRSEDALLRSIASELEKRGYRIRMNVGCSGYRVDLGVVDPECPETYLLGILCDGNNHNVARTAHDRVVTQSGVLQMLGWRLYHVWAMDWWENRSRTIETLVSAIEEEIRHKSEIKENESSEPQTEESLVIGSNTSTESGTCEEVSVSDSPELVEQEIDVLVQTYQVAELEYTPVTSDDFIQGYYDSQVMEKIRSVIKTEAPVSRALLCKRVLNSFAIARMGTRLAAHMDYLLKRMNLRTTGKEFLFYWNEDQHPESYDIYRSESKREALDIAPEEVAVAVCRILREQGSLPEADLIRETAHQFNYTRLGDNVSASMAQGVAYALQSGKIVKSGNTIKAVIPIREM